MNLKMRNRTNIFLTRGFLVIFLMAIVLTTGCKSSAKDTVNETTQDVQVLTTSSIETDESQTPVETVTDSAVVTSESAVAVDESHEGMALDPLTGLYISEVAAQRRPIGIMINNLKAAQPQSGIEQADIIYETLVEGGICRLYALFQDFNSTKIGPVRSARHYFLDFAFDHDALYIHYGQSPQAQAAIKTLKAPALNGLSYLDTIMCFKDTTRKAPHNTYTSYDKLMAAWEKVGYRQEVTLENPKFKFSVDSIHLTSNLVANKVKLGYSTYQNPWFEYDTTTGTYKRFQFDAPQIDKETGNQLAFTNIIIQFANIYQIKGDTYGRMDEDLISDGKGYYVTDGYAIPITWSKKSHLEATHYYKEDGSELIMNPGKTWVSVFPKNREEKAIME